MSRRAALPWWLDLRRACAKTGVAPFDAQYTRAFGLMYSISSVSVYSWTGR
jgi:hypothetical protein